MLGKAPLAAPCRHACFLSCMPCDWYSNSFIYHITRKGYIATSLLSLMGAGGPGETKRRLQSGEFPGCAGQAGGGWAVYSGESRGWQVYYILCLPAKRLQAFFFVGAGRFADGCGGRMPPAQQAYFWGPQRCPQAVPRAVHSFREGLRVVNRLSTELSKRLKKPVRKKQAFLWQNTEIAFAYLTIRRNVVKWKSPAQDIVNGWQSQPFRLFPGHYTKSNIHTEATEPKWLTELSRETGVPSLLN